MPDLYVIGLGVSSISQLTREAEQAIAAANEVLYLDTGVATRAFLEARCRRVTSLYDAAYREGTDRAGDYRGMAAAVLDAALDHPPVCFAVHGHPLVGVYAPGLVLDAAGVLGLSVEVLPGVSAVDSIVAALGVDPFAAGLQLYEATDLLLRRRPLQPDVPALIMQIGNLETTLHSARRSRPARFRRLVLHLLRFYPANHRVLAVYASSHPLSGHDVIETTVADLPDHAPRIHAGHSLYIPAAAARPIEDVELLAVLGSAAHLDDVTGPDADAAGDSMEE